MLLPLQIDIFQRAAWFFFDFGGRIKAVTFCKASYRKKIELLGMNNFLLRLEYLNNAGDIGATWRYLTLQFSMGFYWIVHITTSFNWVSNFQLFFTSLAPPSHWNIHRCLFPEWNYYWAKHKFFRGKTTFSQNILSVSLDHF